MIILGLILETDNFSVIILVNDRSHCLHLKSINNSKSNLSGLVPLGIWTTHIHRV